eukprot:scaffold193351_cov15-Tisochrysis_lutea.AAC.1
MQFCFLRCAASFVALTGRQAQTADKLVSKHMLLYLVCTMPIVRFAVQQAALPYHPQTGTIPLAVKLVLLPPVPPTHGGADPKTSCGVTAHPKARDRSTEVCSMRVLAQQHVVFANTRPYQGRSAGLPCASASVQNQEARCRCDTAFSCVCVALCIVCLRCLLMDVCECQASLRCCRQSCVLVLLCVASDSVCTQAPGVITTLL